jgi:hypothetical protein
MTAPGSRTTNPLNNVSQRRLIRAFAQVRYFNFVRARIPVVSSGVRRTTPKAEFSSDGAPRGRPEPALG